MNRNVRLLPALLLMLVFGKQAQSQQDLLVSQYMFNHLMLNPAYAGSKSYMMSSLLYRKQWVDYEGAPVSQVGSLHGPLGGTRFGWGALVSHDVIGVTERSDAFANLAYQAPLGEKTRLGVGLRMGGSYFTCRNSDLKVWDNSDQVFKTDQVSRFLPNAGVGMLLYGRRSYLGLSAPMLVSYDPTEQYSQPLTGSAFVPRQVRHYYLTGGTVIGLNNDIMMKPSVLVRYVENAPLQADFNLNFLFARTLWIGGSYRTNDAVVGIMELQLNRFFRIGYSYDYTLSDIRNFSSGSHEVMIGYDFGSELAKVTTPRFF